MNQAYLEELADFVDPDKLWRVGVFERDGLTSAQRKQLDAGVALRRYASHVGNLANVLKEGRSWLITPLTENSSAIRSVVTPRVHMKLRSERK